LFNINFTLQRQLNSFSSRINAFFFLLFFLSFGKGYGQAASATTCTGIYGINTDQISIYPNPFTDEITIHTDASLGNGAVLIYDAMGREIKRQDFIGVNIQLNTGSFASGSYMISILADGRQIAVRKLFKLE
jgi:hypothetical protein